MKEDTSFIELTYEYNLKKMDIDHKLINVFKKVMYRLQAYFNEHDYIKNSNYRELFKKHLLTDNIFTKMKITSHDKYFKGGFFQGYFNRKYRVIYVNADNCIEKHIEIILCHEFIHFLVSHQIIDKRKYGIYHVEIRNGGALNKSLTDSLTKEIYKDSLFVAYKPHVKMIEFVKKLFDSDNLYQFFLLGYVDLNVVKRFFKTLKAFEFEKEFYDNFNYYHCYFAKDNLYLYKDAINNEYYIKAQRNIILVVLESINTIEDYQEFLIKITNRPVIDNDFINEILMKKEIEIIKKLNIIDHVFENYLLSNIFKLRISILTLYKDHVNIIYQNNLIQIIDNNDYVIYGTNT